MIFNSIEYALFLPVVLILYHSISLRTQNLVLLASSYLFYGWWDHRFLFLVILSTTIDYWGGLMMSRGRLQREQYWYPALALIVSGVFLVGIDYAAIASAPVASLLTQEMLLVILGLPAFFMLITLFYRHVGDWQEQPRRKAIVYFSIMQNLVILGFFKYFNFFSDSLSEGLRAAGISDPSFLRLDVILPIGVSFYTFQSIAYTIDVYRGHVRPVERFSDFALFVSYFPQLVAGPINRAAQLMPQLFSPRKLTPELFASGIYFIVLGCLKKIAIADGLSQTVDQVYNSSGTVSWADVIVGTVAFAVQIYCDFSGYSDIARGSSRLLGIDMTRNFDLPYFAKNPQEFWRRWHISLSTWLRDYLYIPLGGSRGSDASTYRNLMITMVLGGLWHGAAWNFVLWGAYQGVLLSIHRAWVRFRGASAIVATKRGLLGVVNEAARIAGFFVIVCYGWLLFRANSFSQIAEFTNILIFDVGNVRVTAAPPRLSALLGLCVLAAIEIMEHWAGDRAIVGKLIAPARGLLVAVMVTIVLMGMSNESAQFIYFQF